MSGGEGCIDERNSVTFLGVGRTRKLSEGSCRQDSQWHGESSRAVLSEHHGLVLWLRPEQRTIDHCGHGMTGSTQQGKRFRSQKGGWATRRSGGPILMQVFEFITDTAR
jgi:hypothetical protein